MLTYTDEMFAPQDFGADVLQKHTGHPTYAYPEQDQEVPPTPTASRHVLVLLTWWPKGSLRKGRCQISYSLSYLSKGRTSALAWRPL
ncbi:hypothetical protein Cadr_000002703 [Camelus dromedarius]|uniref:Uncharacterized protein n=1 Tax=Camelus dromedarius TaxID=9838 RepID=A0A5N4C5F8_CAMDR|nr:hypothetical protein Cadr_000002703 [Camelus dromedarius]